MPIFDLLEQHGFEVYLVNARDTRNLPGRKSDVQECPWLRKLHTHGLLQNSFHPPAEVRCLRALWRQRGDQIRSAGRGVQRMQKALTQMNLQLSHVISDIAGLTGMAIVRAIVAGERDPFPLAAWRHRRIKASQEQIAASLQGTWRPELLFVLKQELAMYDAFQQRIVECDEELASQLRSLPAAASPTAEPPPSHKRQRAQGHAPAFDLRAELVRVAGVDLTRIDGLDVLNAQTMLSEVGWDRSRWKTEGHFASWLGLCPNNSSSGAKVLGRATRKVVSRAATAFRLAAPRSVPQPELSRCPVSTPAHPFGNSESDYRHGSSPRPPRLSPASVRPCLCRPRLHLLRATLSRATTPLTSEKGRSTRPHSTASMLKWFLER